MGDDKASQRRSVEFNRGQGPMVAVCVRTIAFGDGVGGMERAAARNIVGLLAHGFRVRLYAPKDSTIDSDTAVERVDVPWPTWDLFRPLTFGLAYVAWVKRLGVSILKDSADIDLVLLHGGAAGSLPSFARASLPSALNPHGMEEFSRGSWLMFTNRILIRRLVRRGRLATRIVATDAGLVNPAIKNIGATSEQVICIPNAVNIPHLDELASHTSAFPAADIVSVGRLTWNKGYDLLARALRIVVNRQAEPLMWLHFGTGSEERRVRALLSDEPRIRFDIRSLSSDVEVQSSLANAHVFVQPSRFEGSSLTTLEAMAHSRIVVATPVGGMPDKIEDGVTGFLANEPSAEAIAEAIERATSSPSTGPAARLVVEERFNHESEADAWSRLAFELTGPDRHVPEAENR